jgi:hypothetical protein
MTPGNASRPKAWPRSWLPEVTVGCTVLAVLVYLLGYQPVARRAESLDRPLRVAWDSFASTNQSSEATAGVLLDQLPARLELLRQASTELTAVRALVEGRVGLDSNVVAELEAPFQLIDFENERLRYAEALFALAKEQKVGFEPAATNGLPQYLAETREPALLWARLHFARYLLLTAIHAPVAGVRDLAQLPAVSHRSVIDGRRYYEELPMRIEVVGPVEGVRRFLASLPLRGDELAPAGVAMPLTNKPALFLSHLLARKSAPERPGEVRVELIASGFVPTEDSDRNSSRGTSPSL